MGNGYKELSKRVHKVFFEKGRVWAGAGTGRDRTWDIWCVLGSTFDGFHFYFFFLLLLGLYIIRIC